MPRYCFLKRSKDSAALRVASLGEEVSRLILAKKIAQKLITTVVQLSQKFGECLLTAVSIQINELVKLGLKTTKDASINAQFFTSSFEDQLFKGLHECPIGCVGEFLGRKTLESGVLCHHHMVRI